jgi:hypothetical protein
MNPNEMARVILDIAGELFRCDTWVLPSSQTVSASGCGATSRNQLAEQPGAWKEPFIPLLWVQVHELLGREDRRTGR